MTEQKQLLCLAGGPAPAGLSDDVAAANLLGAQARAALWTALGPSLPDPLPAEAEGVLDRFCERHGVDPDHLGAIIKALRFVVRAAVARGVTSAELAVDLRTLGADDRIVEVVAAGFARASRSLNERALRRALDLQGESLTGVDFRIDRIEGTRDAPVLDASVAHIVLELSRGTDTRTVAFQAELGAVKLLREACEAIEQRVARNGR